MDGDGHPPGAPLVSEVERALRRRNLRTVAALAALFLLPLAASFWMYYGGLWQPVGRTNHGELLEPVRPLPLEAWPQARVFADKWALVYVAPGACAASCQHALLVMRQTRLSLNQDMQRVNRVLIGARDCCDPQYLAREHAGLIVLDAANAGARRALQVFPADSREHALYLIDPLGNLVMRYDERADPKGLLEDLKKLLKLSHIG